MNFSERFNARLPEMPTTALTVWNPTNGGIARVLHHGDATALLECRQAGRAVTQRSREDGADCSGTTAEARRSE